MASPPPLSSAVQGDKVSRQIRKVAFRSCQEIEKQMDGCSDHTHPYVLFADNESHSVILDLIRRGIRLRYLTQVIKNNLPYCKKMVEDGMEVRHLNGVKGNLSIIDKTYCVLYTIRAEGHEPTQVLVTNSISFVEQQQHFFEILWRTAIPNFVRIVPNRGFDSIAFRIENVQRLKISKQWTKKVLCCTLETMTQAAPQCPVT